MRAFFLVWVSPTARQSRKEARKTVARRKKAGRKEECLQRLAFKCHCRALPDFSRDCFTMLQLGAAVPHSTGAMPASVFSL